MSVERLSAAHVEQMTRINRGRCAVWVADVASEHRKAALQSVVTLLPDENREALHCLLLFLNRLADYAAENQVFARPSSLHYSIHSVHIAKPRARRITGPSALAKRRNCLWLCAVCVYRVDHKPAQS